MKLLRPIVAFGMRLVVAAKLLFNRYEAGQRWGTSRSYLPGWVQDARFDADAATRDEILRKARYFEKNNGLVNRLADLFEQFTVGPCGLQMIPASSDEEWNVNATEAWKGWEPFADQCSRQPFGVLQSLIARRWFIDGEIFILKTRGRNRPDEPARPRVQLIESHRVGTPGNLAAQEGRTIVDGVEVDGRGRPIAYHVRDGFNDDQYRRIPAEQIIHVFEPTRPGEYRGLSFFAAVMNDLHDLDDLMILEMLGAKDAAEKSTIYETASGELNASEEGVRRERFGQATENSSGTDTTENKTRYVKQSLGGRAMAIKIGEKVSQFTSNRPTVTQQWYWDYLTARICAGVGISKLLAYPYSMQGTVTRADLDVMAGFFRSRSEVLGAVFTEIRNYVIGWEIQNNILLADPPSDWRKVTVRPPRSVNVDVGRNSSAMIAEYDAKLRSAEGIFAELGQDYREQFRQIAKEETLKMALETEFNLPAGTMSKAVKEALASQPTQTDPEGNPEDNNAEIEKLRMEVEAYGIGVRGGALTPSITDEDHFRERMGLPALTEEARESWGKEDNVRRPITLTPIPGSEATSPFAAANAGEPNEEPEEK